MEIIGSGKTWYDNLPPERRGSSPERKSGGGVDGVLQVGITKPQAEKTLRWCETGEIKSRVISYRGRMRTYYIEFWSEGPDKENAMKFRRSLVKEPWSEIEEIPFYTFQEDKTIDQQETREFEKVEFHLQPELRGSKRVVDVSISARVAYKRPPSLATRRPPSELKWVGRAANLMASGQKTRFLVLEHPITQAVLTK